ncbi:poly(ADP)-ribose polymerase PARP, putative [Talaromyces stipitatus ATCC 10500]|uniref:Poly [ADP-ribose] polymerase n=1 Tax=Talaromyces stipitatus (strain ATCC 10500 / CBS 375.48 / QM 6759 / NRRL 1006) TaxID=441959 RepID=B8MBT8_TALSN|nr:poly(ADP)-ribose polymerase PARP, putative [Talaromyces stipitatus ATCC 10500]EED18221.1 poly(ADP)-ribose polymerase PARP, putative [Talaromyces stipitatus ATCC 10500]
MVPTPFKGSVIAVSGTFRTIPPMTQDKLKKIIEEGGGTFSPKVSNDCTHLVTSLKNATGSNAKFKQASALNNCHIVTIDWLLESQGKKKKLDEKKYLISNIDDQKDSTDDLAFPTPPAESDKKRPAQAVADGDEPPSKKKRDDETKEEKKIHVPVDEGCKDGAGYEVLIDEDGVIWDASLNLTSSSNNNNKFYRIQLLKSKKKDTYCSWTRWGRVGEMGAGAMFGPSDFESAKKSFEKKFKDKSGLAWKDRLNDPKSGKYSFLERDYEEDDPDEEEAKAKNQQQKKPAGDERPPPESKLPEPIQEVVSLIFNQEYAMKALADLNFDANKLPLGKLSKRTLQTGFQALKDLSELLNDPSLATTRYQQPLGVALETLSNRYFTIIPHAFGRARPPVISHSDLLRKEVELLDNLTDMEIANQIFSDSLTTDSEIHFLDKQFEGLRLDEMTPLSHSSAEFEEIAKYLVGAAGPTHHFNLKPQDIFRIERNGEHDRFEQAGMTKLPNDNRRLLWHGSRSTNFGGILSQGLRIAPPEAPVNGYMFGKGVYFADISTKSAGFCASYASRGIGLMLLCEVQLGDPMHELVHSSYTAGDDAKAGGKLATLGMGSTIPKGWKDAGCVHPTLKGVVMPDVSHGLESLDQMSRILYYNEYIVYDVAQIRQRYLLKVQM